MTTKGRVECHFLVFGRLAYLVIEVEFELGTTYATYAYLRGSILLSASRVWGWSSVHSVCDGTRAKRPRESTPGWTEADKLATSALSHAMNTATVATTLDSAADEETEDVLNACSKGLQFGAFISNHRTY